MDLIRAFDTISHSTLIISRLQTTTKEEEQLFIFNASL